MKLNSYLIIINFVLIYFCNQIVFAENQRIGIVTEYRVKKAKTTDWPKFLHDDYSNAHQFLDKLLLNRFNKVNQDEFILLSNFVRGEKDFLIEQSLSDSAKKSLDSVLFISVSTFSLLETKYYSMEFINPDDINRVICISSITLEKYNVQSKNLIWKLETNTGDGKFVKSKNPESYHKYLKRVTAIISKKYTSKLRD